MTKPKLKSKFEDRIKKSYATGLKYEDRKLTYTVEFTYKPDFSLTTKSKRKILIECKGGNSYKYFNSGYRKKWLAMYKQHKDKYDIRLIFEKDFKMGKKLTASKWCIQHGVTYHIGNSIPLAWTKE